MQPRKVVPVMDSDSAVIKCIKEKLNNCDGKTTIRLLRGDDCEIWFRNDGQGLVSPKIPPANQLIWPAFDAAIEIVMKNNGRTKKGNAQSGAKLGSDKLPLDSVEGYIANKIHGVKVGQSAFGPGFVICAILEWAGICRNEKGYLSIRPMFLINNTPTVLKQSASS